MLRIKRNLPLCEYEWTLAEDLPVHGGMAWGGRLMISVDQQKSAPELNNDITLTI